MKIILVLLVIPPLFFKHFKAFKKDLKDFPKTFFTHFAYDSSIV